MFPDADKTEAFLFHSVLHNHAARSGDPAQGQTGVEESSCGRRHSQQGPEAASLCSRLTRIFNAVLDLSIFPSIWKHAIVVTIPKVAKDPTKPENRRPISLLPGLAKLCKSVVKDRLHDFVETNELLSPNQSDFRPKVAAVYDSLFTSK